jgi:hypothetical protein
MAEWLKARASKACIPLRVSGVRIPLSPPFPKKPVKRSVFTGCNISVNKFWVSFLMRIRQMETLMIRTVSLWIRIDGKYVHPNYANGKQTQLRPQDGEYYLRYAGKWHPVGSDVPAVVTKIVKPAFEGQPAKVEISISQADDLFREIRIENNFADVDGGAVALTNGALLDVTFEAETKKGADAPRIGRALRNVASHGAVHQNPPKNGRELSLMRRGFIP